MARNKRGKIRSRSRISLTMAAVIVRDHKDGITPSKFCYEGLFIAQLRAQLCLAHWPWDAADRAARDLVSEALYRARAERPTWAEGQHAATGLMVKDAWCRQCSTPLRAQQVHFCCGACRSQWYRAFNREAA